MMDYLAKDGGHKIVNECSLPLTAAGVVDRIITDLAVVDVTPDGLVVAELSLGTSFEQVQKATEPVLGNPLGL
jgi:acyl CoA:acetate/3-ketoacid CoA transferase beta subunit